jgi:hypothetical protein
MNKRLSLLCFLWCILNTTLFAQCVTCTDLKEAFKAPKQVKEIHLKNITYPEIGIQFNAFEQLEVLEINRCDLQSIDSNVFLPQLKTLIINNNDFDPWKINLLGACFPALQELKLSNNQLQIIPVNFSLFQQLHSLDLSNNFIEHLPENLHQCRQLRSINLYNNRLSSGIEQLGQLWKIKALNVGENPNLSITQLFCAISLNTELTFLAFDGKKLNAKCLKLITDLPLAKIKLIGAPIKSRFNLSPLKHLRVLELVNYSNQNARKNFIEGTQIHTLILANSAVESALLHTETLDTVELRGKFELEANRFDRWNNLNVLDLRSITISENTLADIKVQLPTTNLLFRPYNFSESMLANAVEPMATIHTRIVEIPGSEAARINEKNIQLNIPTNAFLTQNGTIHTGKTVVELSVFQNPIEWSLSGVPMVFENGNTIELFTSNGIFNLDVYDDRGMALKPNPEQKIHVVINDLSNGQIGEIFHFDTLVHQWKKIDAEVSNVKNISSNYLELRDSLHTIDSISYVKHFENIPAYFVQLRTTKHGDEFLEIQKISPKSRNRLIAGREMDAMKTDLICSKKWLLDTVSPSITRVINEIAVLQNKYRKTIRLSEGPRLVSKIELLTTSDSNCYLLRFTYRDSIIQLPVRLSDYKNNQKNTVFYREFSEATKKDSLENSASALKRLQIQDDRSKSIRTKLKDQQLKKSKWLGTFKASPRQLEFKIANFGLIQCGFFSHILTNQSIDMSGILRDQFGKTHAIPALYRVINLNEMYYSEHIAEKDQPVPASKNSIFIFEMANDQIAVFKSGTNKIEQVNTVELLNIGTISSEILTKLIVK